LLISSWTWFWFLTVVFTYLNFFAPILLAHATPSRTSAGARQNALGNTVTTVEGPRSLTVL
jgi:hypothetical protein